MKDPILQSIDSDLVVAYANLASFFQDDPELVLHAVVNYVKAFELISNIHIKQVMEKFITLNNYKDYENALLNRELSDEQINYIKKIDHSSILIVVSAFDRKKLTQISLEQIKKYKTASCQLHVYNDYSTEYDNSFLESYADKVIQLPQKMGPHNLRWLYFRIFLETDFDFIYMTDNDIIHDPNFIAVLKTLYEIGDRKLPVSIYNSKHLMGEKFVFYSKDGIMLKKAAPGFSMFFDRKMVQKIVSISNKVGSENDIYSADYLAIAYLGLPWITSETSYAEHYGAGGINNKDYESERALNPTEYLLKRRQAILEYLTQDIELQINF